MIPKRQSSDFDPRHTVVPGVGSAFMIPKMAANK